jgi:DNA polymerase-4
MSPRTIIHVDMDAFYASVEVLDNPSLAGKPLIVGGPPESRGVVAAASYEARKFGVHSAMSSYRAKKLCPHCIILAPRFGRYAEVSRRVFDIFHEYTPLVEPISIDEAFLDLTGTEGLFGPAVEVARTIKRRIREEVGLTASVGVAPNKFLAKIASDLEKPDGFVVIEQEKAAALLAELPVGKLWGVGKVTEEKFAKSGIHKVRDLLTFPLDVLRDVAGSWTETLLELARGIDDRPVVPSREPKSIGAETTFAVDIADSGRLRRELEDLVDRVATELRESGYCARTIHLKARYPDFTTVTRAETLPTATASTQTIRHAAFDMLEKRLGRAGRPLRLIGVSVSNLSRAGEGQLQLFPDEVEARDETLDRLTDAVRKRFGSKALGPGTQVDEPET